MAAKNSSSYDKSHGITAQQRAMLVAMSKGAVYAPSGQSAVTGPAKGILYPPSPNTSDTTQDPAAPPPVAPFLTPAQQAALSAYDLKYNSNLQAAQRRQADATATTNQNLALAQQKRTLDSRNANENMAARGLFQSSIRDADLNDIDSTLTMRTNLLNTNLARLQADIGAQMNGWQTNYANTHNYYNQLAMQNAAAQTPVLPAAPPAIAPVPSPAAAIPSAQSFMKAQQRAAQAAQPKPKAPAKGTTTAPAKGVSAAYA